MNNTEKNTWPSSSSPFSSDLALPTQPVWTPLWVHAASPTLPLGSLWPPVSCHENSVPNSARPLRGLALVPGSHCSLGEGSWRAWQ